MLLSVGVSLCLSFYVICQYLFMYIMNLCIRFFIVNQSEFPSIFMPICSYFCQTFYLPVSPVYQPSFLCIYWVHSVIVNWSKLPSIYEFEFLAISVKLSNCLPPCPKFPLCPFILISSRVCPTVYLSVYPSKVSPPSIYSISSHICPNFLPACLPVQSFPSVCSFPSLAISIKLSIRLSPRPSV